VFLKFLQEIENERLTLEHVQLLEENSGLRVQNQKISEEASYAKELASAAAVELKNLAAEVTRLSLQNTKLEKDLQAALELSRKAQTANGGVRKYGDDMKPGRKARYAARPNGPGGVYDDFDSYSLDPEDLKMELQAWKQREAVLEAALAERDYVEEEYRKNIEEAKKREAALENDLANMWVLVAKLKKEVGAIPEPKAEERLSNAAISDDHKTTDVNKNGFLAEAQSVEATKPVQDAPSKEPLVARLKVKFEFALFLCSAFFWDFLPT